MSSSSRTSKQRKSWLLACLYFKFTLVKVNKKYLKLSQGRLLISPYAWKKVKIIKSRSIDYQSVIFTIRLLTR